jgi:hypothetical protein
MGLMSVPSGAARNRKAKALDEISFSTIASIAMTQLSSCMREYTLCFLMRRVNQPEV